MSGEEVCSHVKVVVRVRPLNTKETDGNFKKVVHVVDNHMLIFDPKEEEVTFFRGQRVGNRDVRKRANKDLKFVFDHVFGEDSSQVDVFESTTKGVVDGVLNGYNCTVFAYGATGAGKTHTMLGSSDDPGVMYLTMKELYNRMDLIKEEKVFDMAFSYLEVYNEQIRDLLANSGPLAVREDGAKGVVVQGLTLHQVLKVALTFLIHYTHSLPFIRVLASPLPSSSLSEQIYLRQQDKTASLNPNVRVAKMSLIDLAGSERASATNAKGARLREGANINRSLLALGNVINTLADPKSKKTHIPYRDSKLTRLLKDSLGGNCRTVMIANVSPSSYSYEDTHNTLKYANRAKEIKSTLKSNVVSLDSHIGQYAVICEKQKAEVRTYDLCLSITPACLIYTYSHYLCCVLVMSESLRSAFAVRLQVRKEQLEVERQLKENQLRLSHRAEWHQQGLLFFPEGKAEKATCKYERKMASLHAHQQHLQRRLAESERRFQDNEGWLHRLENEMKLLGHDGHTPEELKKELQCHRLQLQVDDLQQHIEHMSCLITLQDQENKHIRRLVHALLPACRRQHLALKAAGVTTATDEVELEELEHLVQRERGVAWADQEAAGVTEEAGAAGEDIRLQPILLSFSRLAPHKNTPCSVEKHAHRISQRLKPSHSPKVPVPAVENTTMAEPPAKKPIRRKLAVSPPKPSSNGQGLELPHCPPALQEVLRQEGMFPLQYTPEACPSEAPTAIDPNCTFEVGQDLQAQEPTTANDTVVLSPGPPEPVTVSGLSQLRILRASNGNEPPKKLDIPSLLDLRRAKPSYMAMTSAAQGKRKRNCTGKETGPDISQGVAAPKRIKRDPSDTSKPLRVRRFGVSSENEPSRGVVRSVSEGNLDQLGRRKPRVPFLGPATFFKSKRK
uniref:Kinesin-like protein n=1 Tax=Electrophorus electricus TaxID=8005 RepID=A0A4W4GF68_ELEEL